MSKQNPGRLRRLGQGVRARLQDLRDGPAAKRAGLEGRQHNADQEWLAGLTDRELLERLKRDPGTKK